MENRTENTFISWVRRWIGSNIKKLFHIIFRKSDVPQQRHVGQPRRRKKFIIVDQQPINTRTIRQQSSSTNNNNRRFRIHSETETDSTTPLSEIQPPLSNLEGAIVVHEVTMPKLCPLCKSKECITKILPPRDGKIYQCKTCEFEFS